MLSPTARLWTQIAAAICLLVSALLLRSLWKALRDTSGDWSRTQGKVTVSQAGGTTTHSDVTQTGITLYCQYRVGDTDYMGDGGQIGGKSRTMGLLAKAPLKNFPEGKVIDVYYDPADAARSSLQPQQKGSFLPSLVFFLVFGSIGGVLTAHAIAGKRRGPDESA